VLLTDETISSVNLLICKSTTYNILAKSSSKLTFKKKEEKKSTKAKAFLFFNLENESSYELSPPMT
jgi:hypothetical protein